MTNQQLRARTNPNVVASLRSLMPTRSLSFSDALRIAELQASRLLALTKSVSPPLCEAIISELPRVDVRRSTILNGSGMTAWTRGQWHIRLNAAEPLTRQRFTLAHELKHILDASAEDVIYGQLPNGWARDRHVEAVCDHFAACLLMPKAWVKRLWGEGVQGLGQLAWRFEVSQQAMLIRLQYLGLVEPLPRHGTIADLGRLAARSPGRRPRPSLRRRPSTVSHLHQRRQIERSLAVSA